MAYAESREKFLGDVLSDLKGQQHRRIGELAVALGWIAPEQLKECLAEQAGQPDNAAGLGQILLKHRYINAQQLASLLQAQDRFVLLCPSCGHSGDVRGYNGEAVPCPECGTSMKVAEKSVDFAVGSPGRGTFGVAGGDGQAQLTLGKYKIGKLLGKGGMAIVYQATDPDLGRTVALKVLRPESCNEREIKRLEREAKLIASLRHNNIVSVHEIGTAGDQHYIVMDYIEGKTLADALEAGLDSKEALRIMLDVTRAVGYAHQQGVVHRDLKPSNVLMEKNGKPVLSDFGLSRSADPHAQVTMEGMIAGTPMYMAPEQVRALDPGPWTDVWALGVMLYEITTRRFPFDSQNITEIFAMIINKDPARPRSIGKAIPTDLETIILKALEKDSKRRYANGTEMADDLQRFLNGDPILARPATLIYKARKKISKYRWIVLASGIAALCLVAFGVYSVIASAQTREAKRKSDQATLEKEEAEQGRGAALQGKAQVEQQAKEKEAREIEQARQWFEAAEKSTNDFEKIGLYGKAAPYLPEARQRLDELEAKLEQARKSYGIGERRFGELESFLSKPIPQTVQEEGAIKEGIKREADEAEKNFRRALEKNAKSAEAALGIARIALELRDLGKARDWIARAIRINSDMAPAYLLRAEMDFERLEEIRALALRVGRPEPDESKPLADSIAADLADAKRCAKDPSDRDLTRGLQAFLEGEFGSAAKSIDKYLEKLPGDPLALRLCCRVYLHVPATGNDLHLSHEKLTETAIKRAYDALVIRPRDGRNHDLHGLARMKQKRSQSSQAVRDFDKATEMSPPCAAFWDHFGAVHALEAENLFHNPKETVNKYAPENWGKAVAGFTKAIQLDPEFSFGPFESVPPEGSPDPGLATALAARGTALESLADKDASRQRDFLEKAVKDLTRAKELGGPKWSQMGSVEATLRRAKEKLERLK